MKDVFDMVRREEVEKFVVKSWLYTTTTTLVVRMLFNGSSLSLSFSPALQAKVY